MISSLNVEKNTMLFSDFKVKCWKTQCFSMMSSSNVEKHNAFNDFKVKVWKTQGYSMIFPKHLPKQPIWALRRMPTFAGWALRRMPTFEGWTLWGRCFWLTPLLETNLFFNTEFGGSSFLCAAWSPNRWHPKYGGISFSFAAWSRIHWHCLSKQCFFKLWIRGQFLLVRCLVP